MERNGSGILGSMGFGIIVSGEMGIIASKYAPMVGKAAVVKSSS